MQFFTKQKKEFYFKKKKHQIGGDICIAQVIQLKNKKYIVFLNADAMEKSIQGAGGILVLGSVFQSIIQRTKNYPLESENYPEFWIKKAFKELHKVFETFEGSMLVSMVLGLVEEKTGLVYYMNAEHPLVVLYRDGKASFLKERKLFNKLGHLGMDSEIFVSTFQMLPGDQLIIGSDGKDDFIVSKTELNRKINDDESIFLEKVEKTNGEIQKLYEVISSEFELIDDFSLLAINYPNDSNAFNHSEEVIQQKIANAKFALENPINKEEGLLLLDSLYSDYPNQEEVNKIIIEYHTKHSNYQKAKEIYSKFIQHSESSTEILFLGSQLEKRIGNYEESIKIAERVKLRDPNHLKNLIHLADLYLFTNNKERARKIILKIKKIDPKHEKLKVLESKL